MVFHVKCRSTRFAEENHYGPSGRKGKSTAPEKTMDPGGYGPDNRCEIRRGRRVGAVIDDLEAGLLEVFPRAR